MTPGLKLLEGLGGTRITDNGLSNLAGHRTISWINLNSTSIIGA